MTTSIDIRPAERRFHTDLGWLDSHHSFNFGGHHAPGNGGHGLLIVLNDDIVAPGAGFGAHPHRDMEIVTWVVDGTLEHRDSAGNTGVIEHGLAQRMSAGSGIVHSEMNASATEPVRFVQMWVVPEVAGIPPSYEQRDVTQALASGELVPVASGKGHAGAVTIHQPGAAMWVGRLSAGRKVAIPSAPFVHLYVVRGSLHLEGRYLGPGDAARLVAAGAVEALVEEDAEIIVWESDTEVSR